MDALERIGLQESEARLVMQATSSIKNLILLAASSTIEELEESIPVDREALEAIKTFVKDPLSLPSVNK